MKLCPHCLKELRDTALRCKFCRKLTDASPSPKGLIPFVKVRALFFIFIASWIVTGIFLGIFWGRRAFEEPMDPFIEMIANLILLSVMAGFVYVITYRAKIDWPKVIGHISLKEIRNRDCLLFLPIICASIASTYALFLPLSYLVPDFVQAWFDFFYMKFFWTNVKGAEWMNMLNFILLVFAAPITEEIFFRGLIFTRWSIKWGTVRAIMLSSFLFGAMHADIIGGVIFGMAMCLVYMRTKRLILPIIIHALNNAAVWFLISAEYIFTLEGDAKFDLAQFQSEWFWGLIAAAVSIPFLVLYFMKNKYLFNSTPPYLSSYEKI